MTCPYEFNSVSYYYYDYDVVRSCGPSNSSFDGCAATNTLSFNYSACADNSIYMLYSSECSVTMLYSSEYSVTILYSSDCMVTMMYSSVCIVTMTYSSECIITMMCYS